MAATQKKANSIRKDNGKTKKAEPKIRKKRSKAGFPICTKEELSKLPIPE